MVGKLRPVGSRVPLPEFQEAFSLPWDDSYRTQFMGSGTEALSAAIGMAIGRKPQVSTPEVIIPAYGCPDLVSAIIAQGARPVLVDLEPDLPFMSETGLREAVTLSTVAVVGVGFLGIPERLELLSGICQEHSLVLIEDSAQCFPPESSRIPLADFVVLSFGRGKPINLMGGGALLFNNEMVTACADFLQTYSVRSLRINFVWFAKRAIFNALMSRIAYYSLERLPFLGIGETRFHPLESISRLEMPASLFQAGVCSFWSRPSIQPHYHARLGKLELAGWTLLGKNAEGVSNSNGEHRLLRYPVLAPDRETRDRALSALNSAGVGASAFYGAELSDIDGLEVFLDKRDFPYAKEFSSRLLTLPAHEDVRISDINLVAKVLFGLRDN